jgi:hypothetical protein
MIRAMGMSFKYKNSSCGCIVQMADRDTGPELAQFAKLSDEFLRTAVRIMNADTDFDNALELLSCCQEFVDECRVFEQFIHRLFDRIVEVRSLDICYANQH